MTRGIEVVWEHSDRLLYGLMNTVMLSIVGAVLALALGALVAIVLMSSNPVLRLGMQALVDLMRCVPFLMLVYLVYYGLPHIGIDFDNWTSGLAALVLYNTAYMGEILRGIWMGLPRETIEAATAYGYHGPRLYTRIIFPQIFLAAGPMLGNQLIQIIKDTSFLTIIAVPELTQAASGIQAQYFVPFAAFVAAILIYWALCAIVEGGVVLIEKVAEARR
jgi:polar amino acid transport system permease protein